MHRFQKLLLALALISASTLSAQQPVQAPDISIPTGSPFPTEILSGEKPNVELSSEEEVEAAYQFALAKLLVEEAAFEKAERSYEKALGIDDGDPYSHLEFARFNSYMGQIASGDPKEQLAHLEKAVASADAARRLSPDNLDVLRTFAQIHLQIGRYRPESLEVARQAYETLNERTQGDLQVLTSLGQLYLWRREPAKAAAVLEEASRFMPNHRTISAMLVESLLAAEMNDQAEDAIYRLLKIDPAALDYRLQLATLLGERGEHTAAVEVLEAAPERLQNNPQLRRQLTRELYLSGESERALTEVEALLSAGPGSQALSRLRVAILDSMLRYEEALRGLMPLLDTQAASARPLQDVVLASRLLERLGRGDEAIEWLSSHLSSRPAEEAGQLRLILAGTLERSAEIDRAASEIRGLMDDASPSQLAYLGQALSEVYQRAGRFDEAVDVLEEVSNRLRAEDENETADRLGLLRLMTLAEAENWEALVADGPAMLKSSRSELSEGSRLFYARGLAEVGRLDEALTLLSDENIPEPSQRRAMMERVQLLFENERDSEASQLLDSILASEDQESQFLAARILQRASRFGEAIPILEKLLDEEPESRQALFMLGVSQERDDQPEAAIQSFEKLIELEPNHDDALNYLGYMLAERGMRLEDALSYVERANSIDTDNGAYVDSLGWAYYQLGRIEEARQHLEWAARLIPEDPTIFEHLGDVYHRLEETDLAIEAYQRALSLGADDQDAVQSKLDALQENPSS